MSRSPTALDAPADPSYSLSDLQDLDERCRWIAGELGLDVPEVVFHYAPAERVYDIAARGLPGRYSHWRFGHGYEQMRLDHDHGRSRIYELVLNTTPYQAYLLQGNSWAAQLLVIAHVYGHCWFFEHNAHFATTDRKFLHRVRAGAERIEEYARRHGRAVVDDLVDAATAVSLHAPVEPLPPAPAGEPPDHSAEAYDDLFPEETEARRSQARVARREWLDGFPRRPEQDLLGFVLAHAPRLEDWQRDVVSIVRDEAAYFRPQRRTKIANEGFACWTHQQIVQSLQLPTEQFLEFNRLDAQVRQPHPLSVNPYSLGTELWREVERVHDDPTPDERERYAGAGEIPGRQRVLELASVLDDAALVAQYLTPGVCESCNLFAWEREGAVPGRLRITTREADEVRDRLLAGMTGLGVPCLQVVDADTHRRGGLSIEHLDEGVGLDPEYARGTLAMVSALWGRRVQLRSIVTDDHGSRPVWYVSDPGLAARVFDHEPRPGD